MRIEEIIIVCLVLLSVFIVILPIIIFIIVNNKMNVIIKKLDEKYLNNGKLDDIIDLLRNKKDESVKAIDVKQEIIPVVNKTKAEAFSIAQSLAKKMKEESAKCAEESAKCAEEPAKCAEESAKCAEESAKCAEEPAKCAEIENSIENKAKNVLLGIWNWIIFGAEERSPEVSIEYAIGSTWIIRLPIIIFVTGVGFILKYSIENAILGPTARVSLSFFFGLVMLFAGVKLIKGKYHIIAQGLLGGAIAVLYFSSFASSSMYNLVDINIAFALMFFITVSSGLLAIKLDSLLVAIFGTLGGYLTPIMLSTGSNNIFGLYSYMLLLGIGVLFIAKFKKWKLLNSLSFIANYVIFSATIVQIYDKNIHFTIVISFAILFFLLFSAITILNNLIKQEKVSILELIGIFTNVTVFFTVTASLTSDLYPKEYLAFITLGLAIFYILGAYILISKSIKDKALLIFMIVFSVFFLVITIPVLLSNEFLAPAWSILAFLILWMSYKLNNSFLRKVGYCIYLLTFSRLLFYDLGNEFINISTVNYYDELLSRFMSFGCLIISLALGYKLLKKENKEQSIIVIENSTNRNFTLPCFIWITSALLFIYLHFELFYLCDAFYKPLSIPIITFIWLATILVLLLKYKTTQRQLFINIIIFLFIGILLKTVIVDLNSWNFNLLWYRFSGNFTFEYLLMRMLNFIPMIALFAFISFVASCADCKKNNMSLAKLFAITSILLTFLYTSLELNTYLFNYIPTFRAGAISILWGIFAVSFIFTGITKGVQSLRFSGLILLIICSIKVFIYDLSRLDSLYRIITFITLGIIFLLGAFIFIKHQSKFSIKQKE